MSLWTPPRTWNIGEKVRAAILNAQLRDNLLYLYGPPRVSLRRTEHLSVPDGDHVPIPYTSVLVDAGGWYDPGSPEVVVIPEDGFFLVSTRNLWDNNAQGDRQVRILRDGDELAGDRRTATTHTEQPLVTVTNIEEGQSLGVDVRQTSGSTVNLEARLAPATRSPVLTVIRLAPPLPGL